jgi:hypothetical protein
MKCPLESQLDLHSRYTTDNKPVNMSMYTWFVVQNFIITSLSELWEFSQRWLWSLLPSEIRHGRRFGGKHSLSFQDLLYWRWKQQVIFNISLCFLLSFLLFFCHLPFVSIFLSIILSALFFFLSYSVSFFSHFSFVFSLFLSPFLYFLCYFFPSFVCCSLHFRRHLHLFIRLFVFSFIISYLFHSIISAHAQRWRVW